MAAVDRGLLKFSYISCGYTSLAVFAGGQLMICCLVAFGGGLLKIPRIDRSTAGVARGQLIF
jgi:hypothetical protein